MKIEVNVTKKYFFVLVALFLVLAGVLVAYAYAAGPGSVPSPGHALSQIQGYFSGDSNLGTSLGKFCQSDGTNCGVCPSGWADMGSFCVNPQREAGTAAGYVTASLNCYNSYQNGRLCSPGEWVIACKKGKLSGAGPTSTYEILGADMGGDTSGHNIIRDTSTNTCDDAKGNNPNNGPFSYRCCSSK